MTALRKFLKDREIILEEHIYMSCAESGQWYNTKLTLARYNSNTVLYCMCGVCVLIYISILRVKQFLIGSLKLHQFWQKAILLEHKTQFLLMDGY